MRLLVSVISVFLLVLSPLDAAAQRLDANGDTFTSNVTIAEVERSPALDLSRWTSPPYEGLAAVTLDIAPPAQTSAPKGKRSTTRKILGVVVGATAGLFIGGITGAWIEGDSCDCDDPGLTGSLIGAPVGMVVGGILGGLFLF